MTSRSILFFPATRTRSVMHDWQPLSHRLHLLRFNLLPQFAVYLSVCPADLDLTDTRWLHNASRTTRRRSITPYHALSIIGLRAASPCRIWQEVDLEA